MVVIAHLSDIHVDDGERSAERVARVVSYLAGFRLPIDAVVITGDVTDNGDDASYARTRELIDLPVPVLFCPGNHDSREPFRRVLLGDAPDGDDPIDLIGPVNRAYRVGGALFAMCDSSVPGRVDGLLTDETLDWLDAELTAAAGLPAFVCFHHPPVVLGLPFIDEIRQFSADRLARTVERHPDVVALLCGHAHMPAASTFAGRPLLVGPGVMSTFRLPYESDVVVDLDVPPMAALHILAEERRLTTHYRVVP